MSLPRTGLNHETASERNGSSKTNTQPRECQRRFAPANSTESLEFGLFFRLNHVCKVLARTRKPPISEKENDQRKDEEIREPLPIRAGAVKDYAPIVSN